MKKANNKEQISVSTPMNSHTFKKTQNQAWGAFLMGSGASH